MADREPVRWITVKGKHIPVYKDEHGDDVFGNGMSSAQRIEKQLISEDSYLYSDEYKQVHQVVVDAQAKVDTYKKRIDELKNTIEQESKPDETKGKFADMFPILSDKGKKAKNELDEIKEFWLESAEFNLQMAQMYEKIFRDKQSAIESEKFYNSQSTISKDIFSNIDMSRMQSVKIRPIDTFGSYSTNGELEYLVPKSKLRKI